MSKSEGRIGDEDDLRYFYNDGEVAHYENEGVYYDPTYRLYYHPNGQIYNPHRDYNYPWFRDAEFIFKTGEPCPIPYEEDENVKERKPKRHQKRTSSGRINFIVLGTMSTCSKTDFNGANNPIVDWGDQRECNFAVKSMEGCHCMFWSSDLYGHCSCYEAYDDMTSGTVSLDRIDSIKKKDKEREDKEISKDPEHHFEESEEISVHALSDLYINNEVISMKPGHSANEAVFYHKGWDTFFDGHGTFLREMTKQKRKNNRDPDLIVKEWVGPLYMTKGSNLETEAYSVIPDDEKLVLVGEARSHCIATDGFEDNSGTIDPVELHEFLHEISKIVKSKDPVIWEVQSKSMADKQMLIFKDTDLFDL